MEMCKRFAQLIPKQNIFIFESILYIFKIKLYNINLNFSWTLGSNLTWRYHTEDYRNFIISPILKEMKIYLIIYESLLIKPFSYYIWWEILLLLTGKSNQEKSISLYKRKCLSSAFFNERFFIITTLTKLCMICIRNIINLFWQIAGIFSWPVQNINMGIW